MRCYKCGTEMPDNVKFCGNCGAVFNNPPTRRCPHCNAQIKQEDVFCYACGKSVNSAPQYQPQYTPYQPTQKKSSGINIVIIVLSIILGVALIVAAVMFGMKNMPKKDNYAFNDGNSLPLITSTPAPTPVPAPSFLYADASSIRGTDTEGGTYSVSSVLSPDPLTKWVPAKSYDSGVHEWVKIYSNTDQYVSGLYILNGYHKNSTTWSYNNRVRYCTITFSDGTSRDFTLPDTMEMITLDFGTTVKTSSIKLTITGVYRGTKWNDTAITYIGAY